VGTPGFETVCSQFQDNATITRTWYLTAAIARSQEGTRTPGLTGRRVDGYSQLEGAGFGLEFGTRLFADDCGNDPREKLIDKSINDW